MIQKTRTLPFLTLVFLLLALPSVSLAGAQVLQEGLTRKMAQGQTSFRVIVILKDALGLSRAPVSGEPELRRNIQDLVARSQTTVINRISSSEMKVNLRYHNLPAFGATASAKGLADLAALPEVAFIQEDRPVYPRSGPRSQPLGQSSAGSGVAQERAREDIFSGRNVSIAVVGTGINYLNPIFGGDAFPNSKVIGGWDFGDNDGDPLDCHGHETGVAAVAGHTVAPGSKLYALKICPGCCGTEPSWVSLMIASWDWCVTHRDDDPTAPILFIVNTWADYSDNTALCDAANPAVALAAANCKANGIAIFVAAGNENQCEALPMPSCLSVVYSVGAVYADNSDPRTYCLPEQGCSSWPSSDCGGWLYACRDDVPAKDKVSCCSNSAEYLSLLAPSGGQTSGSTPHAAGAAAVLQSYYRETLGTYLGVDELMKSLYGYTTWIYDLKANRSTRRVDVDELILRLEEERQEP